MSIWLLQDFIKNLYPYRVGSCTCQIKHQSCRKAGRSAQGCFHQPSLSTGIKATTEANDDLLQANSKAKKAVNEFVMTVAHAIPLQIT